MSDLEEFCAIFLYLYIGCVVMMFVYDKTSVAEKEKVWKTLATPMITIVLWPLTLGLALISTVPIMVITPLSRARDIFAETLERGVHSRRD